MKKEEKTKAVIKYLIKNEGKPLKPAEIFKKANIPVFNKSEPNHLLKHLKKYDLVVEYLYAENATPLYGPNFNSNKFIEDNYTLDKWEMRTRNKTQIDDKKTLIKKIVTWFDIKKIVVSTILIIISFFINRKLNNTFPEKTISDSANISDSILKNDTNNFIKNNIDCLRVGNMKGRKPKP